METGDGSKSKNHVLEKQKDVLKEDCWPHKSHSKKRGRNFSAAPNSGTSQFSHMIWEV